MEKGQKQNQLDNANKSAPNSDGGLSTSDNFFDALESQSSGAEIIKDVPSLNDDDSSNNKPDLVEQLNEVKTRYSESSKEAKELAKQLKESNERIAKMEGMLEMLGSSSLESKESEPANIIKALGLPDDFIFDGAELNDPNSDSSKYMFAMNQIAAKQAQDGAIKTMKRELTEKEFREKHKYDDRKWEDFKKWAEEKTLTFEDLHYLYTMGSRDKNIATSTMNDIINQRRNIENIGSSLFNVGSKGKAPNPMNNLAAILGEKDKIKYFK